MFSLNGSAPSYPGPPFDSANIFGKLNLEEMTDYPGGSKTTKPVNHTSYEFGTYGGGTWRYHSGTSIVEDTGPNAMWWGHGTYPSYATFPSSLGEAKFDKSLELQFADTIERFHSTNDVDNVLNIAEANQLPGTLHSLLTTVGTGEVRAALRKTPTNGSFGSRAKSAGKLLGQKLSNSYLAWSFGLAPLISDMKKMSKACKNIHSDMQKDFNRKSRVDTVTTRMQGRLEFSENSNALFEHLAFAPTPPVRICGVKGVRTQQYSTSVFHRLDYLLRKFGTPGPASFVWEKIPYSFMADWFLNLKGVTQELDNLLTGNTKQISDSWFSVSMSEYHRLNLVNGNAIIPSIGTTVAANSIRRYIRTPFPAQRPAVFVERRFGKKQLALTGALLYQKIANR